MRAPDIYLRFYIFTVERERKKKVEKMLIHCVTCTIYVLLYFTPRRYDNGLLTTRWYARDTGRFIKKKQPFRKIIK